jgi:hypothetical protein
MPRRNAYPDLAGNPYERLSTCRITGLPIYRWMVEFDLALIEAVLAEVGEGATWEPLRRRRGELSAMLEGPQR